MAAAAPAARAQRLRWAQGQSVAAAAPHTLERVGRQYDGCRRRHDALRCVAVWRLAVDDDGHVVGHVAVVQQAAHVGLQRREGQGAAGGRLVRLVRLVLPVLGGREGEACTLA
jgi:hypothetical protein